MLRSAIAANRAAYDPVELENVLVEVEDFLERLGRADLNTPIRKNLQAIRARLFCEFDSLGATKLCASADAKAAVVAKF